MFSTSVTRCFGIAILLLGVSMIVPAAVALADGNSAAGNYLFAVAITMFSGAGIALLGSGRERTIKFRSTLLLIFLWWTASPIFGALPFWLDGWSAIDGYFEAVSALTTTGATLRFNDSEPDSIDQMWRAVLQWIGGLSSLAIAASIFIRPAFIGADTLQPTYSPGERQSPIRAIVVAARTLAGVYALLSLLTFGALAAAGAPLLDAVVLSLSTAASGGITPHPGGLAAYGGTVTLLLIPFIILSGASFVMLDQAMRGRLRDVKDSETSVYLVFILILAVVFWLPAGQMGSADIQSSLFNSASLFATNGVTIGEPPGLVIALVTVIIGGSAVSTAGGLKILRWVVIMRRTQLEVRRLVMPSAVFGPKSAGNELGVWMHFLVFTVMLGLLTLGLTAGGHSFEIAAAGAVGALANAGPVITLSHQGADGYQVFEQPPLRALLSAAMITGRLEGVAALMLINKTFWRG